MLFVLLNEWRPVTSRNDWYLLNNGMQMLLGMASFKLVPQGKMFTNPSSE